MKMGLKSGSPENAIDFPTSSLATSFQMSAGKTSRTPEKWLCKATDQFRVAGAELESDLERYLGKKGPKMTKSRKSQNTSKLGFFGHRSERGAVLQRPETIVLGISDTLETLPTFAERLEAARVRIGIVRSRF
jgi:hypothetical protein